MTNDRVALRRDLATLGALSIWAAATGAALVFVALLGSNVPYWDDWEIVPYATGDAPVTPGFLWSLHNEHRIPLVWLINLGLLRATHGDFRASMVANVVLLSGASLLLMRAARRARGQPALSDAAFPLLLLHLGHAANLISSFYIQVVLSTTLLCVVLATVVELRDEPTRSQALRLGIPLLLLPLCGANGLVVNPALGAWLAWRGSRANRAGHAASRLLFGLAGGALVLVGLYLWGYHGNPAHPRSPGVGPALESTVEFASVAFGPAGGGEGWPVALGLAFLATTAALVGKWWWRVPADRAAAEGLLATFSALAALALAVGVGRSGFGPGAARAPRYALLAAPLVCTAYLAWCRLPWPGAARRVRLGLFLVALAAYPGNLAAGTELARSRFAVLQALAADLLHGMSVDEAARLHELRVYVRPNKVAADLGMLQRRRFGPFKWDEARARLRRRFPFVEAPLIDFRDGSFPVTEGRVEGRRVLVVAAEGQLAFDVPPGRRRATGRFGLLPETIAASVASAAPRYDGTCFTIAFRSDAGTESQLLARLLNPRENPQDGAGQGFAVSLPGDGGRLLLSTRFGPPDTSANGFGDWGYWTDVEIR